MKKAAFLAAAAILAWQGAALAAEEKEDTVPRWIERLESEDSAEALKALQRLGNLTYKGAHADELKPHVPRIVGLLEHAEPDMRRAAIQVLQNVKASEHVPDIARRLQDENSDVKKAAIGALGIFKAADHAEAIAAFLEDKDFGIRGGAVDALGKMDAKEHAGRMVERLKDEHHWVRGLAASALAGFGKDHAADIAQLLTSKENDKINAIYALRTLKAEEYSKEVAGLLKDEEYTVRLAALRFVADVAGKDYAPEVGPLLEDENRSVRSEAESLLKRWKVAPEAGKDPPAEGEKPKEGERQPGGKGRPRGKRRDRRKRNRRRHERPA